MLCRHHTVRWALVVAVLAACGALVALAGPLDPPAGPVAPTYKTLAEVEPRIAISAANTPGDATSLFKITQRGSYYLTGNITGVAGKHGIAIAASGVTLDLNGFDLVGVAGMGAFDGVSVTAGFLSNIAVVNGSVRNWGDDGVDLGSDPAFNCRVEGVLASANAGNGIYTGHGSTVTNCSTFQNVGNGIVTDVGCTVTNCSTFQNFGNGIVTDIGCTITSCSALSNTGSGINTSSGSTITNCSAQFNASSGISTVTGCTVADCLVYHNAMNGINTGDGCTITACTVNVNVARGISTGNGCQVSGCMTRNNQSDGIAVNYSCTVSGNTCNGDGLAAGNQGGIRVLGQANRIESNNVTYADYGLLVDAGGNVIVRNTVKGCTINWVIAANNVVGPILDRTIPASAAISGNSAPDSTGSTHPNANFTY